MTLCTSMMVKDFFDGMHQEVYQEVYLQDVAADTF